MTVPERRFQRLSDLIVKALALAIDQRDIVIADTLARALELSLTRNAGGAGFVERRGLSAEIEQAFKRLDELKK